MREDAESTRTDLLARIADTEASLQLSISIASDVAHAAEWNCTMQLDTFDEHLRADLATMHNALSQELAASKEMIGSRMKCTSRALHLLQKLMCRPDGAQLFAEFDTDGDGSVSREELKQGYAKLGEYLSEEDMDAIMALVDQDGDGSMGYEEFVQMGKMTEDVEALRMTMQESLAQLKAESEETMAEKIIPLEENLAATESSLAARLDQQSAAQRQMSVDADTAVNELDVRLKDAFQFLHQTVRDLDQHYTTEALIMEASLQAAIHMFMRLRNIVA